MMLRAFAKLPTPVFYFTQNVYVFLAVAVLLVAAVLLGGDGFSLIDVLVLAALVVFAIGLQRIARPVQSADVPDTAEALEAQLAQSDRLTLLAFESEYCPSCMATNPMVLKLEESNNPALRVIRLTIQHEPGKTLFKKYDGRLTPTFVLLDRRGNLMMDWLLTLPVNRVLFEANQVLR